MTQDVHIHIKAFGSWTHNLIRALAEEGTIPIRVDGPYGSRSAPEFTNYDHILMIGGGIGVCTLSAVLSSPPPCAGREILYNITSPYAFICSMTVLTGPLPCLAL